MSIDQTIAAIPKRSAADREVMRRHALAWRQTGTPQQKADAAKLLDALDNQERVDSAAVSALGADERVVRAFNADPPTPNEQMVIQALLDHPGVLTMDLSRVCGWEGGWQGQFGTLCSRRKATLGPIKETYSDGRPFPASLLAKVERLGNGETNWRYTMKPEAVAAFRHLGFRVKD